MSEHKNDLPVSAMPETVEKAKAKLRQVFHREWSASYPPAQKRVAEEAAMHALIEAVRQSALPAPVEETKNKP